MRVIKNCFFISLLITAVLFDYHILTGQLEMDWQDWLSMTPINFISIVISYCTTTYGIMLIDYLQNKWDNSNLKKILSIPLT